MANDGFRFGLVCHSGKWSRPESGLRRRSHRRPQFESLNALGKGLESELAIGPGKARHGDFDAQARIRRVSQLGDERTAYVKRAGKAVDAAELDCLLPVALELRGRTGDDTVLASRDGGHVKVAQVRREVAGELREIDAASHEVVDPNEARRRIALRDVSCYFEECRNVDLTEHARGLVKRDLAFGIDADLLERRGGITHAAGGLRGDELECLGLVFEALALADTLEIAHDLLDGEATEVEALTAGLDGLGNLMRIGRAQHEDDVLGRLFERLEQRVERRRRQHMHLVDDIDLETAARRGKPHASDDLLAHVVDTRATRSVKLEDIGVRTLGNLEALRAGAIGLSVLGRLAQKRLGEQACRRGLARSARPAEQVRMGDCALRDGVDERLLDMLLPDDVGKHLGTILAVQRKSHESCLRSTISLRRF